MNKRIPVYIGREIISKLQRVKDGTIKIAQKIYVKCSLCGRITHPNYRDHRRSVLLKLEKDPYYKHMCKSCLIRLNPVLQKYREKMRGNTYEGLFGKKRAEEMKRKLSLSMIRQYTQNPHCRPSPIAKGQTYEERYGSKRSAEIKEIYRKAAHLSHLKFKGKTMNEIYGAKRAKEIMIKTKRRTGKDSPSFGKPPHHNCGRGWSGYYGSHSFRSLLELSFIINYIEKNRIKKWRSAETKDYAIPYKDLEGRDRNYFADFVINDEILVEVKPYGLRSTALNILKFNAGRKYCQTNGLSYKIFTEREFSLLTKIDIRNLYNSGIIRWGKRSQSLYDARYSVT